MLVLTRKQKEVIRIGDNVTITILRIKGQSVRVGIDAPSDVRVVRGELETCSEDLVTDSNESHATIDFDSPGQTRPVCRSPKSRQPSSRKSDVGSNCRTNSLEILTDAARKARQRMACKEVASSSAFDDESLAAGRVPVSARMDLGALDCQDRQRVSKN